MRGGHIRWATGLALLGVSLLRATPFSSVDALTTCIPGRSQDYCTLTGQLTGPSGTSLPSSLADITSIKAIIGEVAVPVFDRSPELADQFSEEGYAPVVAGAQMMCSIQLSFDPANDIGGREAVGGGTSVDTRRQAIAAHRGVALSSLQIELTLGAAMTSLLDRDRSITISPPGKRDYVNFGLVNQFHVSTRPVFKDEPEEEEGDSSEGDEDTAP
jgi:hypothetical protein